jgi:DNA-directed RNA polymerase subunit RPC12/RpoP
MSYQWEFKRGWNVCDKCGRFTSPRLKGSSTYFVPDSELTHEDHGLRCPDCTKQFGEIPPSQGCVQKYCSSTNK